MDGRQENYDYGGYDGPSKEEPEDSVKLWQLVQLHPGVHSGVLAQVTVNGTSRGTLLLKDEEEFKWLKPRIDGEQSL